MITSNLQSPLVLNFPLHFTVFYPMALYEIVKKPSQAMSRAMSASSVAMLAVCILATLGSIYAFTQTD